jgi:hypothetical protein
MADDISNNISIHSFKHSKKILGSSRICTYINDYLSDLEAKTVITEHEYIDKDFIIDYSKFYSRAFKKIKKTTTRYHFFDNEITRDEFFNGLMSEHNEWLQEKLQDSYLGYVIKKPINSPDSMRPELVGKTLLFTYDKKAGTDERVYVKDSYDVSLCGMKLKIESLPYQQHDYGVGACATTACWVTLFPLSRLFGLQTLSPIEITEKSVFFPSDCRNFPSDGLTIHQMKTYFNTMGLETEVIKPNNLEEDPKRDVVADIVKAYAQMNIPIIAGLAIVHKDFDFASFDCGEESTCGILDQHAVVISGYRHHKRKLKMLYVHDDAFGPYCYINPIDNFTKWKCRWEEYDDCIFFVTRLLIPIYPKIRLNIGYIYSVFQHKRSELELDIKLKKESKKLTIEFLLFDIKTYKNSLLNKSLKFLIESREDKKIEFVNRLKTDFLTMSLPRFIWVIRYNNDGQPMHDAIYDGTDTLPNLIGHVMFS